VIGDLEMAGFVMVGVGESILLGVAAGSHFVPGRFVLVGSLLVRVHVVARAAPLFFLE
jgi:hypothetical protein